MDQTFMKKQNIWKLVLTMSIPNVISMLVNSLYNIVDTFFVAKISEDAMTALSLVFPIQNLITSIAVGFGVGISASVAILLGQEKFKEANSSTTLGVLLSIIHGFILTIISILIMPWFLGLFTDNSDVINLGVEYANIAFLFAIPVNCGIGFEKIFQAVGRMKTSMFILVAGCITNIILDPLFIFGFGAIKPMGIKGAAIATGIGQSVVFILYIIIYFVKPINVKISPKYLKYNKEIIKNLYSIGVPATLNMALPSLLVSTLNAILAAYSQIYVNVLGIYYKLQTFVYLPANGIIQGIRPLVGYNYGAGEFKRVKKIYRTTLFLTVIIMTIGTLLCVFVPDKLVSLFSENNETIAVGTKALMIICIGFIPSAVSISSCGALEGLGMGVPSLIISLLRFTVLIIPLAFLFSKFFGAQGVWNSFWLTEVITAAISYLIYNKCFKSNKTIKVS